jgi:hypothetical protein
VGDKKYCVDPLYAVVDASCQSSDFVGEGMGPIILVFWALDEVPILHRGSRVWVDDGARPMFCVGCYFGLECSINIFVVIVGENRGDEVGDIVVPPQLGLATPSEICNGVRVLPPSVLVDVVGPD